MAKHVRIRGRNVSRLWLKRNPNRYPVSPIPSVAHAATLLSLRRDRVARLTERERVCYRQMRCGYLTPETIAVQMNVTVSTAKCYRARVNQVLGQLAPR